jgi:peptide deformylase
MMLPIKPDYLRQVCRPLDPEDIHMLGLLPVMGSMQAYVNGKDCIGLAANQLGVPVRIITIHLGKGSATIINPEVVKVFGGFRMEVESCLSFPGEHIKVSRPYRIKWAGFTPDWEPVFYSSKGQIARTVLHEIDHLNGIIMQVRAGDLRLSYDSKWSEE